MKVFKILKAKFARDLSATSERAWRDKAWDSLDTLPILNWWRCIETTDPRWMLRVMEAVDAKARAILNRIWIQRYDEYLGIYGIPDGMRHVIEKQREIAMLTIAMAITGDRSHMTLIKIARIELANMLSITRETPDFFDVKASLETALKMRIDPRTTSVREFMSYVKTLKNGRRR
jgi:hypothetical protein